MLGLNLGRLRRINPQPKQGIVERLVMIKNGDHFGENLKNI